MTRNVYLRGIWVCHLPYDPTTLLVTSHQLGPPVSADDHMRQVDIREVDGLQCKCFRRQREGELLKDTQSFVPNQIKENLSSRYKLAH
jgi:hypothetical protein